MLDVLYSVVRWLVQRVRREKDYRAGTSGSMALLGEGYAGVLMYIAGITGRVGKERSRHTQTR